MNRNTARFEDGPLAGKSCSPPVCPIMLRGTIATDGTAGFVYGTDSPPDSSVYVYMMRGRPGTGFWDGRDERTGRRIGGQMTFAKYRLLNPQPSRDEVTTETAWQAWCDKNETRLRAEYVATTKEPANGN